MHFGAALAAIFLAGVMPMDVGATSTTLCKLARHSKSYSGQKITVSGVVHAGLDRVLLSSNQCPNQPVTLIISNAVAKRPDVAALWSAIYRQGSIGTVGKRISGTIVGQYRSASEWPHREIVVEGVRDLRFEQRDR